MGNQQVRVEQLIEFGIRPSRVPRHQVDDGINGVRMSFARMEFDEVGCAEGLKALRAYRREWDEDRGCWKDKPRHDWASHGADALRYGVMAAHERMKTLLTDVIPPAEDRRLAVLCPSDPLTQRGVTFWMSSLNTMRAQSRRGSASSLSASRIHRGIRYQPPQRQP